MIVRTGVVHLVAEASLDGSRLDARQVYVIDDETGAREQVWPETARPPHDPRTASAWAGNTVANFAVAVLGRPSPSVGRAGRLQA